MLEDAAFRASRVGDWITAEQKALTLGQKRTRSASPAGQTLELLLCRLSMANRAWSALSPTNIHGKLPSWDLDCLKAVRELPGVVEVRCDQHLYGLVEPWPLKEGGWGGTAIDSVDWLGDIHD